MNAPVMIDFAAIDRLCAGRGAITEVDRAELLQVDRKSLRLWRSGQMDITLGRLAELAGRLDVETHSLIRTGAR